MSDFLCKAHSANLDTDYSGYILSRKLNGFSMLWDGGISAGKPIGHILWGKERANEDRFTKCTGLWTGDGHIIHAPEWWYKDFPAFAPLQGECWFNDNKSYSSVCNCTAKNSLDDPRWHSLKFIVYNYKPYCLFPGVKPEFFMSNPTFKACYDNITYHNRLNYILYIFNDYQLAHSSIANLIDFSIVHHDKDYNSTNCKTLGEYLSAVTSGANSWEGLMLANPNGLYTCGRSYDLLKLKPEYDVEVTVIGYNQGDKRHIGRMGSLKVKLKWNEQVESFHGGRKEFVNKTVYFDVGGGFSDLERDWNFVYKRFTVGRVINIKFNEVGENGSIPSARWSGENE